MGTIYHYDIHKTFNSIAQRFEHREIFHVLEQKEIESGKFSSVHVIERVYNPITRRVEEQPVIHILDINKSHTNRTKRKGKKSRGS
jgi:hypothetical protein